jgi:hypothetical protein
MSSIFFAMIDPSKLIAKITSRDIALQIGDQGGLKHPLSSYWSQASMSIGRVADILIDHGDHNRVGVIPSLICSGRPLRYASLGSA